MVFGACALTIDRAAFLLTMAVATATGIAFGLLPAVLASRTALIPALKRDAASQGFRRSRLGPRFLSRKSQSRSCWSSAPLS